MMIIHEVLRNKPHQSVWQAHKEINQPRQYLKLKKFKEDVQRGIFTLYRIEEYNDRDLYWYTDRVM